MKKRTLNKIRQLAGRIEEVLLEMEETEIYQNDELLVVLRANLELLQEQIREMYIKKTLIQRILRK